MALGRTTMLGPRVRRPEAGAEELDEEVPLRPARPRTPAADKVASPHPR